MIVEKRNAYICPKCRYLTLTVHIHKGVTPFMLLCKNPFVVGGCNGMAISFGYQMPGALSMPNIQPLFEWYKPEPEQKLQKWEKTHVNNGGVLLRERTDAEPEKTELK